MFLRNIWLREVQNIRRRHQANPDVKDLMGFVEEAAMEVNDPVYGRLSEEKDTGRRAEARPQRAGESRPQRGKGTSFLVTSSLPCGVCGRSHSLFNCEQYGKYAADHHLCFNCLRSGHSARNCKLNRTCSVDGCGRKHTKFLQIPT